MVRTLEQLTNTRVDHVAMIDFLGFVNLTEDLDGVTVNNRTAFSSQGHTFPAGNITLEGEAALVFVRERLAFGPNGELQRAENQRNVLKAILAKGLSPEVISDPFQFTDFLGNAAKRIKVDKSLSNAELRATAASLRMKPSGITLISAPLGNAPEGQRRLHDRPSPARRAQPGAAPGHHGGVREEVPQRLISRGWAARSRGRGVARTARKVRPR